jgi:hypothetical protein
VNLLAPAQEAHPLCLRVVMRVAYVSLIVAANFLFAPCCRAQSAEVDTTRGDELVAAYFLKETERLTDNCFSEVATLADWTTRRPMYRRQLLEMLGLDPFPQRTPLKPVVTGTIEHEQLIVELYSR